MADKNLLKMPKEEKLELLKDFKSKDILNFEDDFFKVCHSKKKILEDLEDSGKLDEIILILVDKFFELKDNSKLGRTPYSSFLCAWNSWVSSYSMNQPDNFFLKLNCGEIEFSLLIYWIAKKILEKHAKQQRSSSTASHSKASSTQVNVTTKKKVFRNRNSDRIYSLQRLGGGCLGEMWRVNKKRMQVYSKIIQGKKPLTQKQRDIAHKLYQISLSLRNMDQFAKDIPPALIQINQGGLLIPHVALNSYIEHVHDLVVDEWVKWDEIKPGEVLKTMATLMNNDICKEMFHNALTKITEIENRNFSFDELEKFRKIYQRKMGHAKLGDLVRSKIQSRNDRKGKRGIGGQNLRCFLYRNTVKKPETRKKSNRKTQNSLLVKQCKPSKSVLAKKTRKCVPNDPMIESKSVPNESFKSVLPKKSRECVPNDLVIESKSVPNEPLKSVLPKKSLPNEPLKSVLPKKSVPNEPLKSVLPKKSRKCFPNDFVIESKSVLNEPPIKIKKEASSTIISSPKQSRSGRLLRRKTLMDEFIYQ